MFVKDTRSTLVNEMSHTFGLSVTFAKRIIICHYIQLFNKRNFYFPIDFYCKKLPFYHQIKTIVCVMWAMKSLWHLNDSSCVLVSYCCFLLHENATVVHIHCRISSVV